MSDTLTLAPAVFGKLTVPRFGGNTDTYTAVHYPEHADDTPEHGNATPRAYDWEDNTENGRALLERRQAARSAGDLFPRYAILGDWTFTPDAPAEEAPAEPETREAQAQALAAMRRREAAAIERADRFENFYRSAQSVANDRQDELQKLWDALKEQAIERDWCSEFEQFVSDNGGDDYVQLSKTVNVTVQVEVNWRDADSESELADHIYNMPRWDVENSITNYEEA